MSKIYFRKDSYPLESVLTYYKGVVYYNNDGYAYYGVADKVNRDHTVLVKIAESPLKEGEVLTLLSTERTNGYNNSQLDLFWRIADKLVKPESNKYFRMLLDNIAREESNKKTIIIE